MEFLYKLYENEYFGIGLFAIITVLLFLFLIILFFGKKDEKVRKLEETKKLELENINAFKEVEEMKEKLDIPVIEQPIIKEEVIENKVEPSFDNPFVEEPLKAELAEEFESVNEESVEDINFELPDLTANKVEEPVNEENIFQTPVLEETMFEEPLKEEIVEEKPETDEIIFEEINPFDMSSIQLEEETPAVVKPKVEAPFSSVFVNEVQPVQEPIGEPIKEEIIEEHNEFELPKMVEVQKETNESNVDDFDSLFGNVATETYDLNNK